jgi:hypothetical protein
MAPLATFSAAHPFLLFYTLRRNVHTTDSVMTKIMPISFNVALGILNIFEAFSKPIFLSLTALTALTIDSIPHTLRFSFLHYLMASTGKQNKVRYEKHGLLPASC